MAAEDFEDPIGKGSKVYKGKYPNTCITPHPPSPSAYIYMYSLLLYCNVYRTLRLEHYLKTVRTVRSRIAIWIVLWITGLTLWVIFITSFDFWVMPSTKITQEVNNFPSHPLSLHWLDEGATTGTVLTVFSLANWLGSLRSGQCLAVCASLSSLWHFWAFGGGEPLGSCTKTLSGTLKKL